MPLLKPTFLFDAANSRQLPARVTFTRASGGAYFDRLGVLRQAAANQPRFDFDPVTLACRGLLIEEQRTNLLVRSQEFDNASWVPTRASVSANASTAPDGTATADKLIDSVDVETSHFLTQTISHTGAHSCSVFAKAAELSGLMLWCIGATSFAAGFNLSTGATYAEGLGGVSPPDLSVSMIPVGSGWYRCSMSWTAATGTQVRLLLDKDLNGDGNYTGDGTSGLLIWGAQLEAGAFPTSYIPTVASQVTRSADSALISGTAFSSFWRADRGTIVITYRNGGDLIATRALRVSDGTANNLIDVVAASGAGQGGYGFATVGGVAVVAAGVPASAATVANQKTKLAVAYALDDYAGSRNGGAAGTDTSAAVPAVSQMNIGSGVSDSWLNGWIERIDYYPERLTNAELQTLSAL